MLEFFKEINAHIDIMCVITAVFIVTLLLCIEFCAGKVVQKIQKKQKIRQEAFKED